MGQSTLVGYTAEETLAGYLMGCNSGVLWWGSLLGCTDCEVIQGMQAYLRLHWLVGGKVHSVVWNVHRLVLLHWLIGVQRPVGGHLQRGSQSRAAA